MFVLTEHVDQSLGRFRENPERDNGTVYVYSVFSLLRQDPFYHQFGAGAGDAGFFKVLRDVAAGGDFEKRFHYGLPSREFCVGGREPVAQNHVYRVDDQGLSGTGFPRDYVQAVSEVNRNVVYYGEILKPDLSKHRSFLSPPGSFFPAFPASGEKSPLQPPVASFLPVPVPSPRTSKS